MAPERSVGMPELRRLQQLIARLNGCRNLTETLQSVAEGVVEVVGFDVAAVSYRHADGYFETVAVAGDDGARAELLGRRKPPDAYEAEFAVAESWGPLRFVPHEHLPDGEGPGWVPDVQPGDHPDAWHPMDALFAPLHAPSGDLVGMLSVDLPADRRRPGPFQRELLQMFAAQAGIAIDNARLTERLQASEEAFRLAFEGAGTGMALINTTSDPGRYVRVNPALCVMLGYTEEQLLALTYRDITHPDDHDVDQQVLADLPAGGRSVRVVEKRYLRADGSPLWVCVTSSIVRETDGTPVLVISQVEDISVRRAAREELAHRANHDALTGLPNRHALDLHVQAAAEAGELSGRTATVLFCDLDEFKAVNDRHGHETGDRVLVEVARRLKATIREHDTVVRLGGDEFVVVASDLGATAAGHLAERLAEAVRAPVRIDDLEVTVTASIGIAPLERHHDVSAVLREADEAMYRAKAARRTWSAVAGRPVPERREQSDGMIASSP